MKKHVKSLIKNPLVYGSSIVIFGGVAANFFNFLFNLYMSRNLPIADYGILASVISIITFPALLTNAVNPVVIRFAGDYFVKKEFAYLKGLYLKFAKVFFLLGISVFVIFILNIPAISAFFHIKDYRILILADVAVLFLIIGIINLAFIQAKLAFGFNVLVAFINAGVKLVLGIIFVLLGYSAMGAVGAIATASMVAYFFSFIPLRFLFHKKTKSQQIPNNEILKYGIPSVLTLFGLTSFITTDIILVKHFFNPVEAGLYAGLSTVGRIIFYVVAPIGAVMFPIIVRKHANKENFANTFKQGNLLDQAFINELFSKEPYDCVMHFAAYIAVGESMQQPGLYFTNNVHTTISLLDAMKEHNVKKFIFSSTGTVYGTPQVNPIPETHVKNPENPYAESKLMVEKILHWYYDIHGIGSAVLRYFNASGAALDGSMGEYHDPETHLIPNAIKAALNNTPFTLFGDDYATSDGSCIRDYIHVLDLVEAHILTLKKLEEQNGEYIYNVGTGKGSTNKEVLAMVKKISNVDFPVEVKPRRPGDVQETVAEASKIKHELGFEPKYSDLETIIKTAWAWHAKSK